MADGVQSVSLSSQALALSHTINNIPASAAIYVGADVMALDAEVAPRKKRGRPLGSKNKPKQPVLLAGEIESFAKTAVLEISPGSDIIEAVIQFASRNKLSLSVIGVSGCVSFVSLRHPSLLDSPFILQGPYNIVSLTGTILLSAPTSSPSSFGISLAGQQGQVYGGTVAGDVTAAGPVLVVVATFKTPSFHRLPGEFETEKAPKPKGKTKARNGGGGEGCSSAGVSMSNYGVLSPTPLSYAVPPEISTWGGPSTTSRPQPY